MTEDRQLWELERQLQLWTTHWMVARDVAEVWEQTGGLVAGSEGAILLERDIDRALAGRIATAERELARINRQLKYEWIIKVNRILSSAITAKRDMLNARKEN